ncbi:MAG: solute carrier family 23 protein [Lautropia sp.]
MIGLGSGYLGRRFDRPFTRPPGLVYALDDVPPPLVSWGLALQHLSIQSVYFVVPAVIAGTMSSDPADATRFLCLSILAAAFYQLLMLSRRGPIGAGYAIPATHGPATIGAYALVGAAGLGFGAAGAMLMIAGIAAVLLTFAMHRLQALLPNEVAGVVVILIGVTLVIVGTQRLGLQPGGHPPDASAVLVMVVSLTIMVLVALSRTRAAPFAVLVGIVAGVPVALAAGHAPADASALVAATPWIALPQPWLPRFDQIRGEPLLAFLLTLVAIKANSVGTIAMFQRASDANWSRADAPPIRRGLLANGVAMIAAGAVGGACPAQATAAVGLSIATGTLARRIVTVGAALLVVVGLCPKLAVMFVLVPEPLKSAMLFYVAGFIMAQGCQLVTARLLDTRRMLIVAFGLSSGIAAAVAPEALARALPALASPLTIGALVAFAVNLATLPLVARRAAVELPLHIDASRQVTDWCGTVAASWALKAQTARAAQQSLGELVELLAQRDVATVSLAARRAEDRVEFTLTWQGEPLPDPPDIAHPEDLIGPSDVRERFSVWLATRQALLFRQRDTDAGSREARIVFED